MQSRTSLWSVALLAAAASLAAQQQPPKPQRPAAQPKIEVASPIDLYKLVEITGLAVQGPASAKVAKIDDLVLAAADGSIAYVVLATDGVAGTKGTRHLLPWRELELTPLKRDDKTQLEGRVQLTTEQIKALEVFDPKALKSEIAVMACAADVQGRKVTDVDGKGLAKVEDVVIDVLGARVNYVVLSAGGFLTLGEDHYAVPWAKLRLAREANGELKIGSKLDEKAFEEAPEFDRKRWDAMRRVEWVHEVYAHYGCEPYWRPVTPAPVG